MDIDITTTAVFRPKVLAETFETFFAKIFPKEHSYTLLLHLDPWGEIETGMEEMRDIARRYFDNIRMCTSSHPNHANAVKWAWSRTKAKYVFHLEDMWSAMEAISFDDLIYILDNYPNIAQVHLHKYVLADGSPEPKFYSSYKRKEDKKLFLQVDRPLLSPGLFRGDFIRSYAKMMNRMDNPELQVWGDKLKPRDQLASRKNIAFLRKWDYAIYTGHWKLPFWGCRKPIVNMFRGRDWKKKMGLFKENHFAPWKSI